MSDYTVWYREIKEKRPPHKLQRSGIELDMNVYGPWKVAGVVNAGSKSQARTVALETLDLPADAGVLLEFKGPD